MYKFIEKSGLYLNNNLIKFYLKCQTKDPVTKCHVISIIISRDNDICCLIDGVVHIRWKANKKVAVFLSIYTFVFSGARH